MEKAKHTWVRIEDVGELEPGIYYCAFGPGQAKLLLRFPLNPTGTTFKDVGVTAVLSPHLGPIPECDE